jgi:hypothetical protein
MNDSGGERTVTIRMWAFAKTPVLPEAVPVGPLSSLLRRSQVAQRATALDPLQTLLTSAVGAIGGDNRP